MTLLKKSRLQKIAGGQIPPVVRWKSGQTQSHNGKHELLELKPLKHDIVLRSSQIPLQISKKKLF